MLNRRLLRIKVMQALYGLKQAEKSDYYLSLDHIAEVFAPDLNSMEPQNPVELKEKREAASGLFIKSFQKEKPDLNREPEKIRQSVHDALSLFEKRYQKDKKHYKQQMLEEIERVQDSYLLALLLVIDLIDYSIDDEEEGKNKHIKILSGFPIATNLRENPVYKKLKEDKELDTQRIKRNLKWDRGGVRRLFKDELKQSTEVIDYLKTDNPDYEQHRKILVYIAKNIIFKSKTVQPLFDEQDYNWVENESIVRNLVTKTLKTAELETDNILIDISGNWEDDKVFFEELFSATLQHGEELEKLISVKAKNWEVERLALTDSIILKMALSEMIEFPSIPVKVSINEYIELSKLYSTPKSKQFINGMLDNLSQELISQGKIRKSGRGLIDNK